MRPRDIILIVLASYEGGIRGKTMLQKVCYFADVVANLGLAFKAHYYGPFSPVVEQALVELKNLGFVEEKTLGSGVVQNELFGEMRRYDYKLTDDGRAVVTELETRQPDECQQIANIAKRIRGSGNRDYRELSLAAKTYFIARKQDGPITTREIEQQAQSFGWRLSGQAIQKSVELLQELEMVRVK